MGVDNPAWVLPEAGPVRAPPVAVTLTGQARAWKNDTDLGNRLTDPAFGPLGRDAVLTVIRLQNAGKRPDCGTPAREQAIDLARAGELGLARPVGIVQASEVPGTG